MANNTDKPLNASEETPEARGSALWTPGPYRFEHVSTFMDIPGLQAGTFEVSKPDASDNWLAQAQTIEQAQLFAAAPDLYEALDKITRAFDDGGAFNTDEARAALAKARGESPDAK